ncbi:PadR family transcriptional regulator [Methanogenium sp. S4BF]|uniref:PadR family transcriptional regulator n=1 Tax=Methanogenium sp. S4BF TaxID=1789226 RepID=UPI002417B8A0|nr:PadR family transcriptional regulator [Methanogenium sp. S4BF]WFN34499.1 PadR family transcriptional regulator [Methanogenium sp. S4BF]
MKGMLKCTTQNGHTHSLITLYVLHSLHREPKTGYDLLREIEALTGGAWVPSKGTIYPMLRQLADEGIIAPQETGARAKTIYALTEDGEATLSEMKECRHQSRENVRLLRNIHTEIFGEGRASLAERLWEIRECVRGLPEEKQERAAEILVQCKRDLGELEKEEEEEK